MTAVDRDTSSGIQSTIRSDSVALPLSRTPLRQHTGYHEQTPWPMNFRLDIDAGVSRDSEDRRLVPCSRANVDL